MNRYSLSLCVLLSVFRRHRVTVLTVAAPSPSVVLAVMSVSTVVPMVVATAIVFVMAIFAFAAILVVPASVALGAVCVAGALFAIALLAAAFHFRFFGFSLFVVLRRKCRQAKCAYNKSAANNQFFHIFYVWWFLLFV